MLCTSSSFPSFPFLRPASAAAMASCPVSRFLGFTDHTTNRYEQHLRCSWIGIEKKMKPVKWRRNPFRTSAYPLYLNQLNKDSKGPKYYQEVTKSARHMFTKEISFQSKDCEISLAKVLLYIAAEDEAFLAMNREKDAWYVTNERESVEDKSCQIEKSSEEVEEQLQLDGKSISDWLSELDAISKEVEAELVSRDIGCHLIQVLEAVNVVLFELRGFKRTSITLDPKYFYLHSVLNHGSGTAFLISVIYIEVCRRLGVKIVGSPVGEDFLIWPQLGYPEELFKVTSGQSLFAVVNGSCVDDPGSMASDLTGSSLPDLEIATHRDIIGIALANLIRLHWRRASKANPGLMLTSPLREPNNVSSSNVPLLRPQDLRLAITATERLLILQPHKWALRRDFGMMLYYNRQYGEAVQELSIYIAFAPEEEVSILEPFLEKLHLLRLEASWNPINGSLVA